MDAATLKACVDESGDIERFSNFRIFMDAATLKEADATGSQKSGTVNFRIFMDAATLMVDVWNHFVGRDSAISASLWMRPH